MAERIVPPYIHPRIQPVKPPIGIVTPTPKTTPQPGRATAIYGLISELKNLSLHIEIATRRISGYRDTVPAEELNPILEQLKKTSTDLKNFIDTLSKRFGITGIGVPRIPTLPFIPPTGVTPPPIRALPVTRPTRPEVVKLPEKTRISIKA